MPLCSCARAFRTARGLRSHITQSANPRCHGMRQVLEDPLSESEDEEIDDGGDDPEDNPMEVDDPNSPPHFAGDLYSDNYEPGDFPGFEESDHPLSEGQISDDEDISAGDNLSSDDEYK